MKKVILFVFSIVFSGLFIFGETGEQEEIDYLLFMPNSNNSFVNENQARIQLNNIAEHLKSLDLVAGQIMVYGYSALAANNIDPFDLSRQRALFIISELHQHGIPRALFADPLGYGSVDLWGSNTTEEEKAPNRRVRIFIDGKIISQQEKTYSPIEAADSKITITTKTVESVQEATTAAAKEKSPYKFPWLFLLPLLLIPLIIIFYKLSKNKKEEQKTIDKESIPFQSVAEKVTKIEPTSAKIAPIETIADIVNLEEEIRLRAYFRFLGHTDYCDMDEDWFNAVPKVRAEYEAKGYQTYIENNIWWAMKTLRKR